MRKLTIVPLLAVAALLAIPALANSASAATITIGDNFFSPSSKTVSVGTKVRFDWTGKHKHNVTKTSGPGGSFHSETTKSNGINFSKTLNKAGVYKFMCTVHPKEMKLTITVQR
ncbi:MAG TPA: plastocyanin/azurin family copper-binding protein [Solirubrobacterales bacterium]|jgi:plastocyanin